MRSNARRGWSIGGLLALGVAVAVGIWVYPELRRTQLMHSF
jgi:hypothetical protein